MTKGTAITGGDGLHHHRGGLGAIVIETAKAIALRDTTVEAGVEVPVGIGRPIMEARLAEK